MKIYYETTMERLPDNCKECSFHWCPLPLKENIYDTEIKKKYITQRHEKCQLRTLEEIKEEV